MRINYIFNNKLFWTEWAYFVWNKPQLNFNDHIYTFDFLLEYRQYHPRAWRGWWGFRRRRAKNLRLNGFFFYNIKNFMAWLPGTGARANLFYSKSNLSVSTYFTWDLSENLSNQCDKFLDFYTDDGDDSELYEFDHSVDFIVDI